MWRATIKVWSDQSHCIVNAALKFCQCWRWCNDDDCGYDNGNDNVNVDDDDRGYREMLWFVPLETLSCVRQFPNKPENDYHCENTSQKIIICWLTFLPDGSPPSLCNKMAK